GGERGSEREGREAPQEHGDDPHLEPQATQGLGHTRLTIPATSWSVRGRSYYGAHDSGECPRRGHRRGFAGGGVAASCAAPGGLSAAGGGAPRQEHGRPAHGGRDPRARLHSAYRGADPHVGDRLHTAVTSWAAANRAAQGRTSDACSARERGRTRRCDGARPQPHHGPELPREWDVQTR